MPSIDFIKEIQENDRKTFFKDFENSKKYSELSFDDDVSSKSSNSRPLIAIMFCNFCYIISNNYNLGLLYFKK